MDMQEVNLWKGYNLVTLITNLFDNMGFSCTGGTSYGEDYNAVQPHSVIDLHNSAPKVEFIRK